MSAPSASDDALAALENEIRRLYKSKPAAWDPKDVSASKSLRKQYRELCFEMLARRASSSATTATTATTTTTRRADASEEEKDDLEDRLWKYAFYKHIEYMKRRLAGTLTGTTANSATSSSSNNNNNSKEVKEFREFLSESIAHYRTLLMRLKNAEIDGALTPRGLLTTARVLVSLGDLTRYRETLETTIHSWKEASDWYFQSIKCDPSVGLPYNQLAVIATYEDCDVLAAYRYARAVDAKVPFKGARENLKLLLGKYHTLKDVASSSSSVTMKRKNNDDAAGETEEGLPVAVFHERLAASALKNSDRVGYRDAFLSSFLTAIAFLLDAMEPPPPPSSASKDDDNDREDRGVHRVVLTWIETGRLERDLGELLKLSVFRAGGELSVAIAGLAAFTYRRSLEARSPRLASTCERMLYDIASAFLSRACTLAQDDPYNKLRPALVPVRVCLDAASGQPPPQFRRWLDRYAEFSRGFRGKPGAGALWDWSVGEEEEETTLPLAAFTCLVNRVRGVCTATLLDNLARAAREAEELLLEPMAADGVVLREGEEEEVILFRPRFANEESRAMLGDAKIGEWISRLAGGGEGKTSSTTTTTRGPPPGFGGR